MIPRYFSRTICNDEVETALLMALFSFAKDKAHRAFELRDLDHLECLVNDIKDSMCVANEQIQILRKLYKDTEEPKSREVSPFPDTTPDF